MLYNFVIARSGATKQSHPLIARIFDLKTINRKLKTYNYKLKTTQKAGQLEPSPVL